MTTEKAPRIISFGRSDVGRHRSNNEDSFALSDDGHSWWGVVCDGVGGSEAGEVASSLAVRLFREELEAVELADLTGPKLEEIAARINHAVHSRGLEDPAFRDMATTIVALILVPAQSIGFTLHAGDSRIYLLRDEELTLLTRDHNVAGDIMVVSETLGDLGYFKGTGHELTRCLGLEPFPGAEAAEIDIQQGDRFLVCSDGLTNVLEEKTIAAILGDGDPRHAVEMFITGTLAEGAPDNVTTIVAEVV